MAGKFQAIRSCTRRCLAVLAHVPINTVDYIASAAISVGSSNLFIPASWVILILDLVVAEGCSDSIFCQHWGDKIDSERNI